MKRFIQHIHEGNPLARDLTLRKRGIHQVIMSAMDKNLSPQENKERMKKFDKDLNFNRRAGRISAYRKAKGVWRNPQGETEHEDSRVIYARNSNPRSRHQLLSFARKMMDKYKQQAIIHRPPSGEGFAINKDNSLDMYGKTHYNQDNPYGETQFKPRKPASQRPKMTFKE